MIKYVKADSGKCCSCGAICEKQLFSSRQDEDKDGELVWDNLVQSCESCAKEIVFQLANSVYNKKDNPVFIWYCDTDNCGNFLISDKSRTCGCGQRYRMNQTPLGTTIDKVMG